MISFEPCQQVFLYMKDSFGARLKFFRSKAGFSQQQLADKAGLSRKIISDYEVKLDVTPRETNLYKIADALNIDSSNLVPKTNFHNAEPLQNGTVEFKMNLNEFPREFVNEIKEGAVKNNRSISDEFNEVINSAVKAALERYKNNIPDDFTEFDKRPEQINEKSYLEHLNSKN